MDWLEQSPREWLSLGSGVSTATLITLLVGIYLMVSKRAQVGTTMWEETSLATTVEVVTDAIKEGTETVVYVGIKGTVGVPGVYQLESQQWVWDVLVLAGDVNKRADTAQVNYVQKVEDQIVIYVPEKRESAAQLLETLQESAPVQQNQEEKINANTATEVEL